MCERSHQQNEKDEKLQAPSQNWTVHAEFTISHDGLTEQGIVRPTAHTEQDENGAVKLIYRWTSVQTHSTVDEPCNTEYQPTNTKLSTTEQQTPNILFTATPPNRQSAPKQGGYVRNIFNKFAAANSCSENHNHHQQQQQQPISSGYSSEQLLSPNSNSNSTINNGDGRKCKSTCSIVLSTNVSGLGASRPTVASASTSRTQSLRCQTPICQSNTAPHHKESSLYGCGDPWCYHSPIYDETWPRFSPLIEADEYANAPTASFKPTATKNSLRSTLNVRRTCRDASVQTYEMVDKCTSPFLFSDQLEIKECESDIVSGKLSLGVVGASSGNRRPAAYLTRRKTEPLKRCSKSRECDMPMSPDSLDSRKHPMKRFVQHQKVQQYVKPPYILNAQASGESGNNSGNSFNQSQSDKKQRTVHIDVYCTGTEQESSPSSSSSSSSSDSINDENEQVSSPQTVFESSDIRIIHIRADGKSLPHRIAQESTNQPLSDQEEESTVYPSRLSSYSAIRDFDLSSFSTNPWSRMSLSSYDTSWKDTGSDLVSLLEDSHLTNDSAVPRSILGVPIREEDTIVGSGVAITPSSFDSFEYAASEDKARIRRLNEELLNWKSPQQLRSKSVDSDDLDESDDSGKGWSFVRTNLEREDTIKQRRLPKGTVPCKSSSVLIVKQKLIEKPALHAPFTQSPGVFTEQRHIARRFGQIIDVYKKPGHHIGPAKNPDCACDHCTEYFRSGFGRGRTRSVGCGGGGGGGMDYYRWKRENGGRGSEPPQSPDEKRSQSERDGDLRTTSILGLTRNTSLSNM